MSPDYYEVLQVSPNADAEVIESAYKRLAFKYHPDRNPGDDATERMRLLNEAYEALSDPARRSAYDGFGRAAPASGAGSPGAPTPAPAQRPAPASWPPFPWATFWRYPFTAHPAALWASLALFGLALPAALRALLVRLEPGYLASLSGLLSAVVFVTLNYRALPLDALSPEARPGMAARGQRHWGPILKQLAGTATAAAAAFFLVPGLLLQWIRGDDFVATGPAADALRWLQRAWCAGVGVGVLLYLFEKHVRQIWHRAAQPATPPSSIPWSVYGVALAALFCGAALGASSAIEWRHKGDRLARGGDADAAIRAYTEAIGLWPDYTDAYNGRGTQHFRTGGFDRALADFTAAIRLGGDEPVFLLNRADAHAGRGAFAKATEDLSRAIELLQPLRFVDVPGKRRWAEDRLADAHVARAAYLSATQETDKALADLKEALKLRPSLASAHHHLGLIYLDRGEYDRAITSFNDASQTDSNLAAVYHARALAYERKRDPDRALADHERAARLDSRYGREAAAPPMARPPVPPQELPITQPGAALQLAFRDSLAGRGKVLVLTNRSTSRLEAVSVRVNGAGPFAAGPIEPGTSKELGWLEFGFGLERGYSVSLWWGPSDPAPDRQADMVVSVP
jgi:tetratricopeptide (TPR) repeat protein